MSWNQMNEIFEEIVKVAFLNRIEHGFREASDEWLKKWERGEVSILDDFIVPYEDEIRAHKEFALSAVERITIEDLLHCAQVARHELSDLWESSNARDRMNHTLTSLRNYVSSI
jgi:hypothetical protein